MSKLSYRPEIDGLRAVAVLIVLFYHAGLGFSGGYVGVDVFFVISGYLITALIVKDLHADQFRLTDFWDRRIRRITPALTVMVLTTLLAGAWWLLPEDYVDLGQSALAQPLLIANYHFRNSVGYFAGPADLKPLLHTWSLAVEEQFYLVLPLLLILWKRFYGRSLNCCLGLLACVSFSISVWGTYVFPNSAYFLLPSRAWELLVGSLLAVSLPMLSLSPGICSLMSWIGLGAILETSVWYTNATVFPGVNALLPCLGAAGFIAGNSNCRTSAGQLLAKRPLMRIGQMSYSLYLWHWPVLAFMRHRCGVDLPWHLSLGAVGISFGLAWLSWRYIETPLRRPGRLSRKQVFGLAGASMALTAGLALIVIQTQGFRGRFSPEILQVLDSGKLPDQFPSEEIVSIGAPLSSSRSGTFLLWGDSHARVVSELISELAAERGLSGYCCYRNSTVPVPGTWMPNTGRAPLAWKTKVVEFVKQNQIRHVILAARWSIYLNRKQGQTQRLLLDDRDGSGSPEAAAEVLRRGLVSLLADLNDAGVTVWLMQQVPQQSIADVPRMLAMNLLYGDKIAQSGISLEDHLTYQARANAVFRSLNQDQVRLLDPTPRFLGKTGHLKFSNAQLSYYSDGDHLSRYGAEQLLSPLLAPVLDEIVKSPRDRSQERPWAQSNRPQFAPVESLSR